MKRDWEKIREILLHIEEHGAIGPEGNDVASESDAYQLELLVTSGLVGGVAVTRTITGEVTIWTTSKPHLTWDGCDFVDAIRDDTVWEKTKARTSTVGGAVTISILVQLATQYLKEQLGMNG